MSYIVGNRRFLICIAFFALLMAYPIFCTINLVRATREFRLASKPFRELGGYATGPEMGRLAGAEGISRIRLDSANVTDADLLRLRPSLEALPNLETLQLSETQVTGEGLRHLAELNNLRHLYL